MLIYQRKPSASTWLLRSGTYLSPTMAFLYHAVPLHGRILLPPAYNDHTFRECECSATSADCAHPRTRATEPSTESILPGVTFWSNAGADPFHVTPIPYVVEPGGGEDHDLHPKQDSSSLDSDSDSRQEEQGHLLSSVPTIDAQLLVPRIKVFPGYRSRRTTPGK